MKTRWILAGMVLTAMSAAAQTRPAQSSTPKPVGDRGGNQTVMVTGCVSKGHSATFNDPSSASAPGRSGAIADSDFVLMNARMSNDSPTGTAQPSREDPRNTAGAAEAAKNANAGNLRFALHSNGTDLNAHMGHRVEISGRIEPVSGKPPAGNEQTLRVDSVRLIADTCEVTP